MPSALPPPFCSIDSGSMADLKLALSHSSTRGSSSTHLSERATNRAPCSYLPPTEDQREVVLKDIVVNSLPTDETHIEQLTLAIFGLNEEGTRLLEKISPKTWKYERSIDLQSTIDGLLFVAHSEDAGDLGYVALEKDELMTLMATDRDTKLERRFVMEEGQPELEMVFTIAVSHKATPYSMSPFNTEQILEQLSDNPGTSGSNGSSPPDIVMNSVEPTTGGTVNGCVDTLPSQRGLPRLFALVIGINEYLTLPKLTGAVNDAMAIESFLKRHLNVPEDRIRLLLDDQASREGIISEIKGLSDRNEIERGDPILIYYAGHGVQLPAPLLWEAGGPRRKIQGINPCDYEKDRVRPIPDLTIGCYLNRIRDAKGDNITVIFDCCFSASGTRTGLRTTNVRGMVLNDEWFTTSELDLDRDTTRGLIPNNSMGFGWRGQGSHILLAACSETENAIESSQGGRFTVALLKLLQQDTKLETLTYSDILKQIERIPGQNPQVEGIHRNRFLFNAKPVRPQFHSVRFKGGIFTMDAGDIHGVTQHSQFTIYTDYESFLSSTPLGVLLVSEVEPSTSRMRRCEGEFGTVLDEGIAVLSTGGAGQALSIVVSKDLPSSFRACLEELECQRLISIKGADEPEVQLESDSRKPELQLLLEDDHVVFKILDRVVSDYGLKSIYHKLHSASSRLSISITLTAASHFYWHLRRQHHHHIAESVQVQFLEIKISKDDFDDFGRPIVVATESDMLQDGTIELLIHKDPKMYGIKLTNRSQWDLFPFVFYFDHSDWSIETYYHPGTAGKFQAELPLRKLDGTLTIGYGSGGGDPISFCLNRKDQDLDVGHLKIFLSTKPAELRNVEQPSPFLPDERLGRRRPAVSDTWLALQYPIVQHRA